MKYPLESLGDERFQQLCQSLLAKSNPGIQCFPVGQPDGGRDAIVRDMTTGSGKFLVFQVKFVKDPSRIENPREWLLSIVRDEIEKVERLVDRSAIGYFLLTNVAGSAHLDVGSIDRLNALLQEKLQLPAMCWWRDDLERRLDDAWSIKWSYPEIMTGPDFLRAIVESGIHIDRDRRETVIRAFLRDQYTKDSDVRFRQIDLQNRLLDLFVDVPIGPARQMKAATLDSFRSVCKVVVGSDPSVSVRDRNYIHHAALYSESHGFVGAAAFLLRSAEEPLLRNLVLEGAPGQGKSTITQYLCQVHRCRLLQEVSDIASLDDGHRTAPIRLPIRVDLRDFALWMKEENPFTRGDRKLFPVPWVGQLEPFLAALISFHAGGMAFSVEDLVAILKISAVSIILDGLDEVAAIDTRTAVVEELSAAAQRLSQNAASLQVLVTSRPAAFLNSPGMPENRFSYLNLKSLEQEHVTKYFELWAKARGVTADVKDELKAFINAKLGQPHIRELARNPMQLAILLSLLYTKGAALPEKRTALYDAYIDHFFSREAEKTASVRQHRELLLELHRYLGWKMHSDAEKQGGRGSLTSAQLLSVVEDYLAKESREVGLAKKLFEGMERVVVLVSRAQGAIEFEVQPVREYFAARYLFETAPLSTPGNEKSGSRPDRFEVIARSSYWLNVTRFYAGCYSKGEIPSLLQSLRDLSADQQLRLTNHPRQLAIALLSDWVFSQIPRVIDDVIDLVTESNGLTRFLAGMYEERYSSSNSAQLALPESCGSSQLVEKCFEELEKQKLGDYRLLLFGVIQANLSTNPQAYGSWFTRARKATVDSFDRLVSLGRAIGALGLASAADIQQLNVGTTSNQIADLFWSGKLDVIEQDRWKFDEAVRQILRGDLEWSAVDATDSVLSFLVQIFRPEIYHYAIDSRQPIPMVDAFARWTSTTPDRIRQIDHSRYPEIASVTMAFVAQLDIAVKDWGTSLVPWKNFLEPAVALWGECRAARMLAIVAASVKTGTRASAAFSNLFDTSSSLCERTRYARLHAREAAYFIEHFEGERDLEEHVFLILIAVAWCPVPILLLLLERIDRVLASMSEPDWAWIYSHGQRLRSLCSTRAKDRQLSVDLLPAGLGLRTASLLATIVDYDVRPQIVNKYMQLSGPGDRFAQSHRLAVLLKDFNRPSRREDSLNLDEISRAYSAGGAFDSHEQTRRRFRRLRNRFAIEQAHQILQDPKGFPAALVHAVEQRYRREIASLQPSVAEIAEKLHWFE